MEKQDVDSIQIVLPRKILPLFMLHSDRCHIPKTPEKIDSYNLFTNDLPTFVV